MSVLCCTVLATSMSSGAAFADGGASMFRFPDVSDSDVVFVYANDLWTVPLEGGTALPLASPPGVESMPRFSPDGDRVAFVGNYEGGRDLYVLPVDGGMPHRVTHHPAGERLSDWSPDGDLLYSAGGMGGVPRAERIYRVDADGGLPAALPMPYGAKAAIRSLHSYQSGIQRNAVDKYEIGRDTAMELSIGGC